MAENTPKGKITGIKQAWRNPQARKGMLWGGAVLGCVALIAAITMNTRGAKPVGPVATARVVAPPTGLDDVTGRTPENYKQLVRDADQDRSEKAKANTTAVVLPRITGLSDPEQMRKEEEQRLATERGKEKAMLQAASMPPVRNAAQQAGMQQQSQQVPVDPNAAIRQSEAYKSALMVLKKVMDRGTETTSTFAPIMAPSNEKVAGNQGAGSGAIGAGQGAMGGGASVNNAAILNPPKPLMRAGEVLFANTDIALNSDYSGPITATIREGKFNGARLMGQKALERGAVVIRFSTLSPSDGTASFPVQAYAVSLGDAKSFGLTGLQGDTDYHMLERYVLPGAISFVQAFGLSATQKGSTAVVNNGGVGTTTPGLTNSDRVAVAVGSAMTPLINDIRLRGQRPITVSMPAGTEIGIMFGADVQNPIAQRQAALVAAEKAASSGNAGMGSSNTASIDALRQQALQARDASAMQSQMAMQQYMQTNSMNTPGYGAPGYGAAPYGAQGYGQLPPGAYSLNPAMAGYR